MSQVGTSTEAGWRPDPSGRYEWRYWDGGWTNRVANSAPPAPAPAAPASPAAPPAPAVDPTFRGSVASLAPGTAPLTPPVAPFGVDVPYTPPAPAPVTSRRRSPWGWLVGFLRSFADQPESYHVPDTAPDPVPDPRGENMIAAPGNYGLAGIVALAACGVAGGAYLPWLSGTIDGIGFHRSGFDLGHGWGYVIGALALAISALLSVHMRVLRWLTVVLSLVIGGFVARDLVKTYDAMQSMNRAARVDANVGMGLMIMVIAAAVAMIGAVRASETEKFV